MSLALRDLWRSSGDTAYFRENELLFRSHPTARVRRGETGNEESVLLLRGELVGGYPGGIALVWKSSTRPSPDCVPEVKEVALANGLVTSATTLEQQMVFGREVHSVFFRATDPEGRPVFGQAACEIWDPWHSVLVLWAVSELEEKQLLRRTTNPRVYDLLFQVAKTRGFLRF